MDYRWALAYQQPSKNLRQKFSNGMIYKRRELLIQRTKQQESNTQDNKRWCKSHTLTYDPRRTQNDRGNETIIHPPELNH